MPDIKEFINGKEEDLIKLFYIIDDTKTITNSTELGKILTACQNIGMDFGVTVYDIVSGKIDSDFALMLEAKLWIDDEISRLPSVSKKKLKKTKKENKIVEFKKEKE
jgi:hypothetical protein